MLSAVSPLKCTLRFPPTGVLQSADFDFLLACGQTTPNNNPARTPTTADQLPPICRDSVLLRFDPLLGRQEQLVAPAVAKAATAEKSMQNNSGDDNDEYGLNGSLPLNSDDHANRNRAAAAVQFADAEAGATGLDDDDDTEGATFAVAAAAAATVSTTAQQAAQHSSAIVNAVSVSNIVERKVCTSDCCLSVLIALPHPFDNREMQR